MRNPIKDVSGKFGRVTLDAEQIRGFSDAGMSRKQIAARLRIDPKTLQRFIVLHGIDPQRGKVERKKTPEANALWGFRFG